MSIVRSFFARYRFILFYGFLMALLVFALKWLQWKYLIADYSTEVYAGLIAIFFTIIGIWIALQLLKAKPLMVEKEVLPVKTETPDQEIWDKLQLSIREKEVLQLLINGHTNAQIADELYLSVSTIKTHVSNLYVKLNVKNRVQAVQKVKHIFMEDIP